MKSYRNTSVIKRIVFTALLIAFAILSGLEITAAISAPQSWDVLLIPFHLATIIAAAVLLVGGLGILITVLWFPVALGRLSVRTSRWPFLMCAAQPIFLLFVVWFFLYSPWQVVFLGLWTRALFLLGLAQMFSVFAEPRENITLGHREIILGMGWFLYIQSIPEIRHMTIYAEIYRGAALAGFVILAGIGASLYWRRLGEVLTRFLLQWRRRAGWARFLFSVLASAFPIILLYIETPQNYVLYPFTRFTVFILGLFLLAILVSSGDKFTSLTGWLLSAGLLLFTTALSNQLIKVISYPFSLYWSEGNRFYDYSLSFASHLYDYAGKLVVPYFSPARYALWGSLFIIPGLPIWVHRLWNAFLLIIPALVVGWLMARKIRVCRLQIPLMVWIALFLLLGSIQANLLVSLFLFLPFIHIENKWIRGISLVATSILVGLNRWTWVLGPAAWGALVDLLLFYPKRKGNFFARILPTVVFSLAGLLPGLLVTWAPLGDTTSNITFNQPLLWYRLWPNATYSPGIIFGTLFAAGPLLVLLIWLVVNRRWKLDWVQALAAGGVLLGFLSAGVVISVKIGGGGDLHNLDLYLITLALITGLAFYDLVRDGEFPLVLWPRWAQVLFAAVLLVPALAAYQVSPAMKLPPQDEIQAMLDTIQSTTLEYQKTGEILFMDQRQLLTFGYVKNVPFVPDYEKKYMMDQAMAGNAPYFLAYYHDLANHRFSLIITEPLNVRSAGKNGQFGEENDAWVRWVSAPTLCFYKPLLRSDRIGVALLVPNPDIEACARYLAP